MAGGGNLAEVNIKVGYNVPALKIGYTVMCVMFPLWTIALQAALGVFLGQWGAAPGNINPWLALLIFIGLSAAIFVGYCLTTNLSAGKFGITFPFLLLLGVNGQAPINPRRQTPGIKLVYPRNSEPKA